MTPIHPDLSSGRWHALPLVDQLGNIGSEVARALSARRQGMEDRERDALDRALELFDLTIADPKHRERLKEICRAREVICDYFFGGNDYGSTPLSLDGYFLPYAVRAREQRMSA